MKCSNDGGLCGLGGYCDDCHANKSDLLMFLNDKWKEELGMQAEINTLHLEADMDAYMKHKRAMAMYAKIFGIVRQNAP